MLDCPVCRRGRSQRRLVRRPVAQRAPAPRSRSPLAQVDRRVERRRRAVRIATRALGRARLEQHPSVELVHVAGARRDAHRLAQLARAARRDRPSTHCRFASAARASPRRGAIASARSAASRPLRSASSASVASVSNDEPAQLARARSPRGSSDRQARARAPASEQPQRLDDVPAPPATECVARAQVQVERARIGGRRARRAQRAGASAPRRSHSPRRRTPRGPPSPAGRSALPRAGSRRPRSRRASRRAASCPRGAPSRRRRPARAALARCSRRVAGSRRGNARRRRARARAVPASSRARR